MFSVWHRIQAQVGNMSSADVIQFAGALLVTMSVGAALLVVFFKVLATHFPSPQEEVKKEEGKKLAPRMPTKIPRPKRNIPPAAASLLVEKGHRLREDKEYSEALRCYLALLYAAVEEGGEGSLPKHLTDCLRGAAECYKALDKYDDAVRFLQAERMVYEEMVAQEQKLKSAAEGSQSILKTLFAGKDPSERPHRCEVLDGVAEASLKHGYNELGLSYRVKAAALKHRLGGKPLDPDAPELAAVAQALEAVEHRMNEQKEHPPQTKEEGERSSTSSVKKKKKNVRARKQPPEATAVSASEEADVEP